MKKLLPVLCAAASLLIVGCGGSGGTFAADSPARSAPTEVTQQRMARLFMMNRSMQGSSGMPATSRQIADSVLNTRSEDGGGDTGGGGDESVQVPQFELFYELWYIFDLTPPEGVASRMLFFTDEALTDPAGEANLYITPTGTRNDLKITKGPKAGTTFQAEMNRLPDFAGYDLKNVYTVPGDGTYTYENQYRAGSADAPMKWSARRTYQKEDNSYGFVTNMTSPEDGKFLIESEDSAGYSASLLFDLYGSGTGTINGPDPGLPAKLAWNGETGEGTITWADGTVTTFSGWDFFNRFF